MSGITFKTLTPPYLVSVPSKDIIWGLTDDILDWPKLYRQFKGCRGRKKRGGKTMFYPHRQNFRKSLIYSMEAKQYCPVIQFKILIICLKPKRLFFLLDSFGNMSPLSCPPLTPPPLSGPLLNPNHHIHTVRSIPTPLNLNQKTLVSRILKNRRHSVLNF